MPYYEDEWLEMRAEAHAFMHNMHKKLIEDWCEECKVTTPVGYYHDYATHTLHIYTDWPGKLIGKGGEAVRKFEETLSKEFRKPYKVKFIEVRGGFVNIKEEK